MKITLSRAFQLLFLVLFFFLFVTTDYRGKDEISVALNSFFRMDPLSQSELPARGKDAHHPSSSRSPSPGLLRRSRQIFLWLDLSFGDGHRSVDKKDREA